VAASLRSFVLRCLNLSASGAMVISVCRRRGAGERGIIEIVTQAGRSGSLNLLFYELEFISELVTSASFNKKVE
jgi:hypothetical protein